MIILTRGIAGLCSTVMASLAEGRPFTQRREGRIRRPHGSNWLVNLLAGLLTTIVISNFTHAQRGQVVNTQLTSQALEGNKLGHSATKDARVYLPPSYETSTRRYPVAYYLHGLGGDQYDFFNLQGHLSADRLIQDGTMDEMIIVGVDGRGGQTTTGFLNSDLNGNYADYITQDLVDHIDTTFRTIADRDSRAIFGVSYGGQATLHYAMLHSDVFGAAYARSSGIVTSFSRPGSFLYLGGEKAEFADYSTNAAGNDLAGVKTPSDIQSSFLRLAAYGLASVFSPNLDNPPLHVDLPFEVPSLEIIPEVRDKWLEYDHFLLLEDHVAELSSLRGLAFDVGDRDNASNIRENTEFHEALVEAGVPHQFEVFSGGHGDKLSERIAESLVFLSNSLYDSVDLFDCSGDGSLTVLDANCAPAESVAETLAAANLIIGDADGDGEVQFADFLILSNNFDAPGQYTDGDFDKDGQVRFADFLILSQNFGQSAVAVAAVPEPSIAILFLVLVFVAMFRRSAVRGSGQRLMVSPRSPRTHAFVVVPIP